MLRHLLCLACGASTQLALHGKPCLSQVKTPVAELRSIVVLTYNEIQCCLFHGDSRVLGKEGPTAEEIKIGKRKKKKSEKKGGAKVGAGPGKRPAMLPWLEPVSGAALVGAEDDEPRHSYRLQLPSLLVTAR